LDERPKLLTQTAPWPYALEDLVRRSVHRAHEGWTVRLVSDFARDENAAGEVVGHGTTLIITTKGYDSYHPERGETYRVIHYFPVPPAAYDERSWRRWLLERVLEIERHEACEFFQIGGERPYALSARSQVRPAM
jgi:hypothetical protein